MAKTLPTIDINNDNWGDLIGRVNQIVTTLSTEIMTANGDPVTGDSTLNGSFYADQLYDSNVRVATQAVSIVAGTGLTGGGTLANNIITVSINSNTAASLTKIDDLTDANTSTSGLMSAADKTKLDSVANGASVSSVGISVPTGFSVANSPITSSGTLTVTYSSGYEGFTTALKNSINNSVQLTGAQTIENGAKAFISTGTSIANSGSSLASLEVKNANSGAAFMTFHRSSSQAVYFGLDNDNKLKVGGWSWGNNAYEVWHANNFNPASYLPLAGGTMGVNAVIQFANGNVDKIKYFGNLMGVGIEANCLTHWSTTHHRWKTGSSSSSDGTTRMELSTTALSVTGNITATGDVGAYSDEQLKSNVETIESALDKVSNLRGVYYTKDDKRGMGVIAQEVQKVIPEVVGKSGEYLTVSYGNLVGVLIEAIKELKAEVETLKRSKQ